MAVFGLPDAVWGEKVCAVVTLREGMALTGQADKTVLDSLRAFGESRLAPYKLPTVVRVMAEIPRNAMGKVNKKALRKELFP
jgi:acyl-CoA synthetase (AMP-forming)/AMP-acid ligase II